MIKRIDRVVIVGGGTAGWIAAHYMLRWARRQAGIEITVVESKEIGTVGAGEGSTLSLRGFFDTIGLDEGEFLRTAKGSFKLGILFQNWLRGHDSYVNPFSNLNHVTLYTDLSKPIDYLKTASLATGRKNATQHCVQCRLMEHHKAPYVTYPDPEGLRSIEHIGQCGIEDEESIEGYGYAYHFDAKSMGDFLRQTAIKRGAQHIEGTVVRVDLEPDAPHIRSVRLKDGREIHGDLFIDASGFHRLILGKTYGVKWSSYRQYLPNDSAIPFDLPRRPGEPIPSRTTATSLSAGWLWEIPLQERTGCGYVYSSDFLSPERARAEVEAAIGHTIEPRPTIRFEAGRLERHFVHNCVAVGLASNFAEPLEATSIHATIIQMHLLVGDLTRNFDFTAAPIAKAYNDLVNSILDDIRDFLVLHYRSRRVDSPYWRHLQTPETVTEEVKNHLELWKYRMPTNLDFPNFGRYAAFTAPSYFYVLDGLGLLDPAVARREIEHHGLWEQAQSALVQTEATNRILLAHAIDQVDLLSRITGTQL